MWEIITLAFSFFLLLDPLGNVPLYIAILKNVAPERRKKIIMREMLISLMIILLFAVVGEGILNLLNISPASLSISGGLLLFIIALQMIFSSDGQSFKVGELNKEPFIVPLAVPLVAGPSILAAVMIFAKKEESEVVLFSAIIIAWLISFVILLLSDELKRILKENAISAMERLMGLILSLIAVQMFLEGLELFFTQILSRPG
jgi:multiple antibiotic resistance protein